MNPRTVCSVLVAAVALLVAAAPAYAAGPLTIKVCGSAQPTFKRAGDDLQVWCPNEKQPALTVAGCVGPKVTRVGSDYTITCASWKRYTLTPS